ncbi:hypothetical protein EG329_003540 [Mollisiaceae sp. DMI_Dod_QoI]|nr:hypothetical protein EG329_003540 [Helotiales sp. DMI_Dod_QoI]
MAAPYPLPTRALSSSQRFGRRGVNKRVRPHSARLISDIADIRIRFSNADAWWMVNGERISDPVSPDSGTHARMLECSNARMIDPPSRGSETLDLCWFVAQREILRKFVGSSTVDTDVPDAPKRAVQLPNPNKPKPKPIPKPMLHGTAPCHIVDSSSCSCLSLGLRPFPSAAQHRAARGEPCQQPAASTEGCRIVDIDIDVDVDSSRASGSLRSSTTRRRRSSPITSITSITSITPSRLKPWVPRARPSHPK